MSATTDGLIERLAALDSTVVSDALDGLGIHGGLGSLRPLWGAPKVVGRARTIQLEPDRGGVPGPHLATSVVASARQGDVLVVANEGRLDVSCWGGILSLGSVRQGVVGVIADGVCRDVAEAEQHKLPVFSRGVCPRTARGRVRQRASGVRVQIEDVPIHEGDLALADDSGVVFVPLSDAEAVLGAAEAIASREAAISTDIRAGVAIDKAMHDSRLAGDETHLCEPAEVVGLESDRSDALDLYATLPTAAISDALDRLGLPGSLHGIGPLREGQRAVGPAFTVAYEPINDEAGTVGDFLDDVVPGSVIIIANDGRTDCTVWGGIMTQVAQHRGVAGTVIDGVCRDVETSGSVDYPIWSAGRFMRTGRTVFACVPLRNRW